MKLVEELKTYFPKYETVLPVSKIKVSFSPFRVKDAKNLAIILQENNKKLAVNALYEILKNNCERVDPKQLLMADAEYLFLQIRSKSIDEIISIIYENNKYKLNINEIKCVNNQENKILNINSSIVVELESPTLKDLMDLDSFEKNDFQQACIKKIIVKNEIYDFKKYIPDEIKEIMNNLPISILTELDKFIQAQPKLTTSITLTDGSEKEVNGLLDFFIFR